MKLCILCLTGAILSDLNMPIPIPALRPYLRKCELPIIAMTATASSDKVRRLSQVLEFDSDRSIFLLSCLQEGSGVYRIAEDMK
jgi:hypothetical protein